MPTLEKSLEDHGLSFKKKIGQVSIQKWYWI